MFSVSNLRPNKILSKVATLSFRQCQRDHQRSALLTMSELLTPLLAVSFPRIRDEIYFSIIFIL